ncbi:serine/threonine-protein kinase [Roseomonas genomospecies 6]|uniref:Serine/threonine protein kinase n=1 Tax=Roseomonas genomospecies 6 TaxID=214106 RepID=A0A9W7NJA8_9PROT|nr:serine/threonine-protein kinase [Roseomonas genomospecies 6]KAA0680349.1 serine/threonine protein kinase [Roseomonas genomospecies 6]
MMAAVTASVDGLDVLPEELLAHVTKEITAFEIERVSDKGANGYLVFGRNNISGKKIAVKYYYWGGEDKFHAEPQKLAGINHKNVIQLDHAGYVNREWAFFIMPHFQNGDLDDYIARNSLSLKQALYFVLGIASALSELHSKALLHRDIKPENILLSDTGEAVIADFGSVKQIPEGADTVPGSGHSLAYRPPESWEGFYGRTGDIYQCGVVLYQLLGGRLPYSEMDWLTAKEKKEFATLPHRADQSTFVDQAVRKRIQSGRLLDLDTLAPWVPKSIRTLISKATSPAPPKRHLTASDLCIALNQHLVKAPAWQSNGSEVSIDSGGKSYRIVEAKPGFYVCEKRVSGDWRKHNAVAPGTLADVCASLKDSI